MITISLGSLALSAISPRVRMVSASDSQWIITGHPTSRASSKPLSRTLLDASHISSDTGKWGLPISPMATALPSSTAFAAISMPSTIISSALSRP